MGPRFEPERAHPITISYSQEWNLMGIFIWTEAFNCGEILNPMLSSYIKHHSHPIHVFGSEADFREVTINSSLIIFENLRKKTKLFPNSEDKIRNAYKKGHRGTAMLWQQIICSRNENILIHLDSDTIFLNEVITDLVSAIQNEGYAIAGSRRAYRNRGYRKNGRDGKKLDLRSDCVNTDCFAFTKNFFRKRPRFWLRRKILGRRVTLKPVVDFFDPITFEIVKNGGKVKYMDSPNRGTSSLINYESKFMESRISFAAVGSGCNFYKNGSDGIPEGYSKFALASYSLYASYFLNKDIGIPHLHDEILLSKIKRLDQKNWTLAEIDS